MPAPADAAIDEDLKRERPRVIRVFQRYDSTTRANRAASHRLGHRQRRAVGEFYYTHPDVPNRAFPTRGAAASAAVAAQKAVSSNRN